MLYKNKNNDCIYFLLIIANEIIKKSCITKNKIYKNFASRMTWVNFILFFCWEMAEQVISQTKLFVSGLPRKMRGKHLREEFEKFWEVVFARVVLDNETGRSRGFGFVEFANAEDAAKAQAEMNEKEIRERQVKVDFAKENPERKQAREAAKEESEEDAE